MVGMGVTKLPSHLMNNTLAKLWRFSRTRFASLRGLGFVQDLQPASRRSDNRTGSTLLRPEITSPIGFTIFPDPRLLATLLYQLQGQLLNNSQLLWNRNGFDIPQTRLTNSSTCHNGTSVDEKSTITQRSERSIDKLVQQL